jgi:diacylglycerol kinase (ATP)
VKPVELGVAVEGREVFAGRAFLFLILNSPGAGHFVNLAPGASLSDGKMDLLILKDCTGPELMAVLLKALAGRHTQDPHFLLFRGETFRVEGPRSLVTDLDGEEGPALPWQVEVLPQRLPFLC